MLECKRAWNIHALIDNKKKYLSIHEGYCVQLYFQNQGIMQGKHTDKISDLQLIKAYSLTNANWTEKINHSKDYDLQYSAFNIQQQHSNR